MSPEPLQPPTSLIEEGEKDENLIARSLEGDRSAFDQLVTRYRDRVYSLALHMLWDTAEAEDVAQEVFIRAYRSLAQFRQESGFFTWLYRIAVNLVYTQTKRAARRREIHNLAYKEMKRTIRVVRTPNDWAESKEAQTMVHAAIQKIDPRLRQVLVLRELEGLDVAEVAALLRLPKGTVKSRHFRAREDLRRILLQLESERCDHDL